MILSNTNENKQNSLLPDTPYDSVYLIELMSKPS